MPGFHLPNFSGKMVGSESFAGAPAMLVVFMCNHCPYVRHIREGLVALIKEYQGRGVAAVGINANDATVYLDDSPQRMAEDAVRYGYTFPYLYDESQSTAKSFKAVCTPDFFLFDKSRRLVYRGQIDDSRPGNGVPVTGKDLRTALDAVIQGTEVTGAQKSSLGCNIKWKSRNEPDYISTL